MNMYDELTREHAPAITVASRRVVNSGFSVDLSENGTTQPPGVALETAIREYFMEEGEPISARRLGWRMKTPIGRMTQILAKLHGEGLLEKEDKPRDALWFLREKQREAQ